MSRNAVQLAAQMYDARDAMRGLYKDKFPAKVAEYQVFIKKAAALHGCDELKATMKLIAKLEAANLGGIPQALLLAAYVELVEPSTE